MTKILVYFFAFMMIGGAIGHLVVPEFYAPMVPDFVSLTFANIASVIAEGVVGIALVIPRFRKLGALLFMLLMLGFLPIHIWDWTKDTPAIGPSPAPEIRIVVQLIMIYAGWWLFKKH